MTPTQTANESTAMEGNRAQAILLQLKEHGAQTSQQLAEFLGVTPMGARKHLLKLRDDGLVEDFSQAEKAGRPNQYWQLSPAGQQQFPDRHGELNIQLIDAVEQVFGAAGLEQLIQQRERQQAEIYQQALNGLDSLPARLARLAQLRRDEGYMARWEADAINPNQYWLHENHCPICSAAQRCQNFCRSELNLFQQLFAGMAAVERVEHIVVGARRCSYRLNSQEPENVQQI